MNVPENGIQGILKNHINNSILCVSLIVCVGTVVLQYNIFMYRYNDPLCHYTTTTTTTKFVVYFWSKWNEKFVLIFRAYEIRLVFLSFVFFSIFLITKLFIFNWGNSIFERMSTFPTTLKGHTETRIADIGKWDCVCDLRFDKLSWQKGGHSFWQILFSVSSRKCFQDYRL